MKLSLISKDFLSCHRTTFLERCKQNTIISLNCLFLVAEKKCAVANAKIKTKVLILAVGKILIYDFSILTVICDLY